MEVHSEAQQPTHSVKSTTSVELEEIEVIIKKDDSWLSQAHQRQEALTGLQSICNQKTQQSKSKFSHITFCQLFSQENVLQLLFQLFDTKSKGQLVQSDFVEFLQVQLGISGKEFVDLLDTLCYIFAKEDNVDFSIFCRIWKSKGVLPKLFALIDVEKSGQISTNQVMSFITECTQHRKNIGVGTLEPERSEELFRSIAKDDIRELDFEDFKKLIPCKNPFFAERVFQIFDKDGSNSISLAEFREGLEQFCCQSDEEKVRCLFRIYDENGNGLIHLRELFSVLKACTEENGMKFSETQLEQLTVALYDDARRIKEISNYGNRSGITYEELRNQLLKHPGLVENLSISLDRILLPSAPKPISTQPNSKLNYIKNNIQFLIFVAGYLLINFGLFINRVIQYQDSNIIYILARASGQTLNFNCAFILVLMLRHGITMLRQLGYANFLPLDQHVHLHIVCGVVVAALSSVHTLMHLINFPIYIAGYLESPITGRNHSASGMFGLYPGLANLTGWVLVILLIIMAVCSLPVVRRSGSFEVFYWTHLLYIPFWIFVILHGPNFWKWFIGPGLFFLLIELPRKIRFRMTDNGRTYIDSAVLLPSRVTHLIIRKPPNFRFHPGDYVYVKIPAITSTEWHPFTISSAPELQDYMWLHIRCAGGWTNKLYEFFEREQARRCIKQAAQIPKLHRDEPSCGHCQHLLETSNRISAKQNIIRTLSQSFSGSKRIDDSNGNLHSCRFTLEHFMSATVTVDLDNLTNNNASSVDLSSNKDATQISLIPTNAIQVDKERNSIKSRPHAGHSVYRYLRNPPDVMSVVSLANENTLKRESEKPMLSFKKTILTPRTFHAPETVRRMTMESHMMQNRQTEKAIAYEKDTLEIAIDGPYGAPSSHIFRAQHAVLIAAGIGVTPFASILQSIMHRYYSSKQTCPRCQHSWATQMPDSIMNLKKVDFFWINRDQCSFEWFVNMLSQLEMEQKEIGGVLDQFLDLHMYITSALKKNDMKAVGLQMALDLLHAKEKLDLVTGLKTRTNAGRPNWDKVFQKLLDEDKGEITIFYCGPPQMAKDLSKKCNEFGFNFRKEIF